MNDLSIFSTLGLVPKQGYTHAEDSFNGETISIDDFQEVLYGGLRDPFISKYIVSYSIYESITCKPGVTFNFKNGNTSGSHVIEGDSLKDVLEKMNDFFKAMKRHEERK